MLSRRQFLRVVVLGGAGTLIVASAIGQTAAPPSVGTLTFAAALPTSPPPATYELRLFGPTELKVADQPVPAPIPRRLLDLLGLLSLVPNVWPTDELSERLYPRLTPDRAQHLVQARVYALRHSLGKSSIRFTRGQYLRGEYRLDPDLDLLVDVHLWRRLLAHARGANRLPALSMAARLYRGPLLPGLSDPLVNEARDRLRRQFVSVVCELAPSLLVTDPQRAILLLRRAEVV